MAANCTVYCRKSVADVTPGQLYQRLTSGDLHLLAEGDGVPDEAAEEALDLSGSRT